MCSDMQWKLFTLAVLPSFRVNVWVFLKQIGLLLILKDLQECATY
jgi:hypothetical protein